jgi:hypothetical protein
VSSESSAASTLRADLAPLEGKYYGSKIVLRTDDGHEEWIMVWVNSVTDFTPSERELEGWDVEEYGEYEVCDNHYETQGAYLICKRIVETLNGMEL